MSIFTLQYPERDAFLAATGDRNRSRAYIRGLAILDDFNNAQDEARTTRALFEQGLLNFAPFGKAADSSGALRDSLYQGASVSSRLKPQGSGHRSMNEIALGGQLRLSLRERLLDLFERVIRPETNGPYDPDGLTRRALSRDVSRMRASGFPESLIRSALEVDEELIGAITDSTPSSQVADFSLPRFDPEDRWTYLHTNSKGVTYYLLATQVTLRVGGPATIYFFAKDLTRGKGVPVPLPENRIVKENPRNGFLTISKRR